jgi:gliding motility-associated lipoprotein GldH
MKRLIYGVILIASLSLFSTACDPSMEFDDFHKIPDNSWHWDQEIQFPVNMADTSSIFNILIQLRHTTDFPLSNLYMFVNVRGPSGQEMKDTINFILSQNNGKWIGKGIGNIREIAYMYKRNTKFPEAGEYLFSIEQAMRLPDVPVAEIGLRIERINQK